MEIKEKDELEKVIIKYAYAKKINKNLDFEVFLFDFLGSFCSHPGRRAEVMTNLILNQEYISTFKERADDIIKTLTYKYNQNPSSFYSLSAYIARALKGGFIINSNNNRNLQEYILIKISSELKNVM